MINRIVKKVLKAAFAPRILTRKIVSATMPGPRKRRMPPQQGPARVLSFDGKGVFSEGKNEFLSALTGLIPNLAGSRLLIKINLNTADPYPASTSPEFLSFFLSCLGEAGASRIIVGDCSSNRCLPTRRVFAKTSLGNALGKMADIVFFDEGQWVKVPVKGHLLREVTVPKIAFETDLIVFLANMKSHGEADFSFGLKLAVGLMHPEERRHLHRDHLAQKIAEINLAIEPDLTLIDGRLAMINGGPDYGDTAEYGRILMGRNPLAVDLEAYRALIRLRAQNGVTGILEEDPFSHPQLRHALRIGLGGQDFRGYQVIEH